VVPVPDRARSTQLLEEAGFMHHRCDDLLHRSHPGQTATVVPSLADFDRLDPQIRREVRLILANYRGG
jgi:hypothetical protein